MIMEVNEYILATKRDSQSFGGSHTEGTKMENEGNSLLMRPMHRAISSIRRTFPC